MLDILAASFAEAARVSKLVFGNQDRLVVAAAVAAAESTELFGEGIADKIGISAGRVGKALKPFVDAGLLIRLPQVGSERKVYYQRADSVFWKACEDLCDEIAARG